MYIDDSGQLIVSIKENSRINVNAALSNSFFREVKIQYV